MADFGDAGKRTVRVNLGAVEIKRGEGAYLYYKLAAEGAEPSFTFVCKHRSIHSASDFPGHPKSMYEWVWGKESGDSDASDDMYVVGLLFIAATKYTLLVEHQRKDNTVIEVLKDIDYESQDPNDSFGETLRVFLV